MKKNIGKNKRKIRVRKKLKDVNLGKYRVSIFKSLRNISAQIIDDKLNKTLVSASSTEKEIKKNQKNKVDTSNLLGEILAKRALDKKINKVFLDRGANKYHGRVKIFADALRKNGLKI
tara:strand:- start:116 stop:469 length:354 start_codon:yes stop_codon:yes gene_type:complete